MSVFYDVHPEDGTVSVATQGDPDWVELDESDLLLLLAALRGEDGP